MLTCGSSEQCLTISHPSLSRFMTMSWKGKPGLSPPCKSQFLREGGCILTFPQKHAGKSGTKWPLQGESSDGCKNTSLKWTNEIWPGTPFQTVLPWPKLSGPRMATSARVTRLAAGWMTCTEETVGRLDCGAMPTGVSTLSCCPLFWAPKPTKSLHCPLFVSLLFHLGTATVIMQTPQPTADLAPVSVSDELKLLTRESDRRKTSNTNCGTATTFGFIWFHYVSFVFVCFMSVKIVVSVCFRVKIATGSPLAQTDPSA